MAKDPVGQRYVIMSKHGFRHSDLQQALLAPAKAAVKIAARAQSLEKPAMRVLESIGDDGPKLVAMPDEGELSLRLSNPELQVVREVFYHRQWFRPAVKQRHVRKPRTAKGKTTARGRVRATAQAAAVATAASLTILDRDSGKPLAGAHVVVFTDFANRVGAEGTSGANGVVRLTSIAPGQELDRAYIYPPSGHWGYYAARTPAAPLKAAALKIVKLRPIDIHATTLLLRQLYGGLPANAGNGVTVGIIDTGIDGNHPDLQNVTGGLNCVGDEVRADPAAAANWGPAATEGEHGTHVAGIVGAGAGGGAGGFRGVAPGVKLRSYRVFPNSGGGASNFDIAKAIDAAVADGCNVINMSLGGGPADPLTRSAVERATAAGVVVVAAAGNDTRKPVSYPAAFPDCVAVSAMGRRKSFPAEAIGSSDIAPPSGGGGNNDFLADFSNFGMEIDVTGAGVEIVSTLPGGQYGAMSGTSMATPAVTGFTAYLLGITPTISAAPAADRSRKLKDLLYSKCKPEGFGREYEGFGLPQ